MKTHKLSNHIILSGITVSMLFSPLMAINPNQLPSGGKFTHGTSGSISGPYLNGGKNTIDVIGKTPGNNHVIQWGGGFSIGKDAQVNFKGDGQHNYLNIAHGTSKSMIEGILNAGGNNVFLINPNGVIITKTGTINANRFVASTSSLNENDYKNFFSKGASFSPVFKPNPKGGNVINMGGEINAASVVLQGNKVVSNAYADYDKNLGEHSKQISANEITLQGNEVYVDVSSINGNKLSKLNIKGGNGNSFKGSMYLNASGYYYNPSSFKVFNKFNNSSSNFKVYKYVGIGSDVDWWHFAKGWNENKEGFRDTANEYRLTNDIDFKASNGQNYANYCIDWYGCTNMIVGFNGDSDFTKTFDGQGYTLKNINIDTTGLVNNKSDIYVGIFGIADGAKFKNINVDYMGGGIKHSNNKVHQLDFIGGFIGRSSKSNFKNISLKDIYIKAANTRTIGGFIGDITGGSIAEGIYLDNIKLYAKNSRFFGGFEGMGHSAYIKDIYLNKIYIKGENIFLLGGFSGYAGANYENIILNNITSSHSGDYVNLGGFAGDGFGNFNNIFLKEINICFKGNSIIGGFMGKAAANGLEMEIENIFLQDIDIINKSESHNYIGGFIGFNDRTSIYSSNIVLDKLYIDSKKNGYTGGFIGYYETDSYSFYPSEFKNIFIFFKENTKISSEQVGKFFGKIEKESIKSLSNIHIYHHENDLSNAIADQNYWGNTNDKIQIHTYDDDNKDEVYNKFKEQADTISKPILPIMPPPSKPSEDMNIPDVEKIKNETATLDENDLISDDIWDYIINDIDKVHYNIDIRLLAKLLNEYSDISNKTEDEQVKFITTYLDVKENDARALLQSLSFLNAYKDHDINKAKFTDETVKDSFEKSFINAGAKFTNFNNKKNKLYNELKVLNENIVSKGFNIERLLDENQEELAKFIKAYNDYVVLIEKGLANENDPLFVSIKSTIIKLNTEAKTLYAQLLDYKGKLQDFKDNNEFEKVIIAGDFKTIPLLIAPDVNKPIDGGGEIEIPDKPIDPVEPPIDNKPDDSLAFEQSSTFNSIGNETLNEEEETEEIDETSLVQKSKTCIVSDNYKTMNPCVAGM
ncbi:filamentous hemagglutinin N-terminal domain-containing protein [Campylobacter lari]|uniref:two-partner secretion domain-containing protein n=1 Tax=Campylobacter lari TaxID=201 RepID=UPI0021576D16|nr:filamentous hemagglutinin N-terminal domain-containing protein [Campylobacter lari]MCR6778012.1 filamentous hemagglutinin N-terminal domain-containing protein [Campylobacter lari]